MLALIHGHMSLVYIGTYTKNPNQGIYACNFDPATGSLTSLRLAGQIASPSFLAFHPKGRFLYAVSEVNDYGGENSGAVAGFSINQESGELKLLNKASSRGASPCHLVVDSSGRNIIVANYVGGSVAVLPARPDGRLGDASALSQHIGSSVNPRRQQKPHAHCVTLSPDNRFALVADLGLDRVLVYRFDWLRGTLTPNDPPLTRVNAGAGPRHCAFHPDGRHLYVINELQSSVTVFAYDPAGGALKELQTISALPEGFQGASTAAEVQVHPSGKFLYGSNRGHDSIAVFSIDPQDGKLALPSHSSTQGKTPRHFGIDPSGTWLLAANQDSNSVVVFRIDATSGGLTPTGHALEVGSPVCVLIRLGQAARP